MELNKTITLTTLSKEGGMESINIPIHTIKKIIERLEGSRLFILPDPTKPQVQIDVIESADEVKSLIVQAK
jgi:hypothetical protein